LAHKLPETSKVAVVKHHPALAYTEVAAFMTNLRKREGSGPRAERTLPRARHQLRARTKVHVYSVEVSKTALAKATKPAAPKQRSIFVPLAAGIVALIVIAGGAWYFLGTNRPATVTLLMIGSMSR
jgi:hypothetical protein